jgi:hypothetical protein
MSNEQVLYHSRFFTIKEETVMKRMQKGLVRFGCALASLAMLIWPSVPVRATPYEGTLRHDQAFLMNCDNSSSSGPAAISVVFVNTKNQISGQGEFTVPGAGRAQFPFEPVGKNITRVIVEVSPNRGGTITVEVAQNVSLQETCTGDTRLVFDVE